MLSPLKTLAVQGEVGESPLTIVALANQERGCVNTPKWLSNSLNKRERRSLAMDAMIRALRKAAWSPFSDEIERAKMPRCFN